VCSTLPCAPFPAGATGTAPAGYPTGKPYQDLQPSNSPFVYNIGIYNNNENVLPAPKCSQATPDPLCRYHDGDDTVIVYARCSDPVSGQSRATQAVINAAIQSNGCPYRGMARRQLPRPGQPELTAHLAALRLLFAQHHAGAEELGDQAAGLVGDLALDEAELAGALGDAGGCGRSD
jgi:hypothetical protein